jgi:predicted kinase
MPHHDTQTKTVYVLRGSPASGKTTVTGLLVQSLPGRVATIELDTFRWNFHLRPRAVAEVGEDEHRLAYENFLSVLENYCRNGSYTIVIEGLFSWDRPSAHGDMRDILECLSRYNFRTRLVRLEAPLEVLWNRNMQRDYVVPRQEFEELFRNVMEKSGEPEERVDVSNITPETVVRRILFPIADLESTQS